ncbi:cysteine-rich receptor-like protein kinase 10 isoform X2 [Corylus avellana]|uniref:cysteine-rich receptor-like protein kinase 10 isoform X2 n=1 Tax=Corylus avellana TaxID=13451 RepID=UPI00286B1B83|nr:cysteine-rich receptor-like protein kinase 10 isoform X2 [Corylus avellana]
MAMVFSRLLLFLSPIFILLVAVASTGQPRFIDHVCSNVVGNYSKKSTYEANLNNALSSITSNNDIDYGFYSSSSSGQEPDKVYAIGLCRGDLKKDVCRSCLNDSTVALKELCPNQKEAIGWYDNCSLRFSNTSMFGIETENPNFMDWNSKNVSDINGYGEALKTQLDSMISEAASGGSFKFATRSSVAPDLSKIYVLVQCTPDLSEQECSNCLQMISVQTPLCCTGKDGARYYKPSCNFRYESYPFFDVTAAPRSSRLPLLTPPPIHAAPWSPPLPPVSHLPINGKERNTRTAIIIVVPTVIVMLFAVSIFIILRMRKPKDTFETADEITSVESVQFDFGTIRAATNNFSDANKLGKGGFGAVYRGRLSNGQEIAVKRLSRNSGQGDVEFKNEVLLVAKLQHRNLVRLLGFCLEGNERLLIYEFVPKTSLDHYIFDPMKRADLNWGRRYKIIGGIARGLLYLHEDSRLRIIHRDLKTGNILLDANMNPKISDFGMARLFVLDQTEGSTNRIVGTYGYMAPEYAMFGQFSTKLDVFSFGILILEIISGRKITNFRDVENMEYLLSYVCISIGMEKLEGRDNFKSHRSHANKEWSNN